LRSLGADERDFEIRVSDRRILETIYDNVGIPADERAQITRLLDKREKVENFKELLAAQVKDETKANELLDQVERTTSTAYLEELRVQLEHLGVGNMIVDTTITRGFDYYTGMVFEIFDTSPENRRSMFGGGRYDNLLSMFGGETIPAVGFGMGDVTARDFLEAHNLMPAYAPATELMVCIVDKTATNHAIQLAQDLRRQDIAVSVNFSGKRIGDQIKGADKMKVPFILVIGEKERDSGRYAVKNLESGNEVILAADRIAEHLFSALE
jgi:histidyl-tRNA synthetase